MSFWSTLSLFWPFLIGLAVLGNFAYWVFFHS